MFEVAALTYGVLASFIMSSVSRNKREARRNPAILTLFSWVLMAFSMSSGLLLTGYVAYEALSGAAVA